MTTESHKNVPDYEKVERGDIVLLDFNPQSGKEIYGTRYALVLSPNLFNKNTGFVSICPLTSTKTGFGFEVDITGEDVKIDKNGVEVSLTGVLLTHQLKNLDGKARRLKIIGTMPEHIVMN